ncbi:MAG: hypothetical protein KGJ79_08690 [Alphaproteobacteria bacterium]|nr:hypothetical protein [Alphaproteobacteria bacterium]MDE2111207.1 hypothetical protein [Alphaproteobacteria bacterium]MDE2496025.1 hypothetical protein [Alphaproteobacteria bacterium]
MLGLSWLKQIHVYIDCHNQTVYLTPAPPNPRSDFNSLRFRRAPCLPRAGGPNTAV